MRTDFAHGALSRLEVRAALLLYRSTAFLSAGLLFLVQPMFARMALPLFGGAPAVWVTATLFFQAALLAGYAYAHGITAWLDLRRQMWVHVVLVTLASLALPVGVPEGWKLLALDAPIGQLLALMVIGLGLPFFVVSATAPLLQRWFSATSHPHAPDPYFLYAASNAGSMLGLLSYPVAVEPSLSLAEQSRLWSAGYGAFGLLVALCAAWGWRANLAAGPDGSAPLTADDAATRIGISRRARWALLAFVPTSLMLSLTTYLSARIAAAPFLWVGPLGVYLLTFILVFSRRPPVPHRLMVSTLPTATLTLVLLVAGDETQPSVVVIPVQLAAFFVIAMVCHGALVQDRPVAARLTDFYLWISVGGVLGGIFNAVIAPHVFTRLVEYPLGILLGYLVAHSASSFGGPWRARILDVGLPLALAFIVVTLSVKAEGTGILSGSASLLTLAIPALVCYRFRRRPLRFALGAAALVVAGTANVNPDQTTVHAERSFFGIYRVVREQSENHDYSVLYHGTIEHGRQSLEPSRRLEPLSYYHAGSPIGQIFALAAARSDSPVAVVGLGTGSLACHGRPGEDWTFYEIDPAVERIALNPALFTFLRDCPPASHVILGDARLTLTGAVDGRYRLIILDAYNGGAIPVHLLTREAIELYLAKLAPGGLLAFHVSNGYLDLESVLGALARSAGLVAIVGADTPTSADRSLGRSASDWVAMVRHEADLGKLLGDARWQRLTPAARRLWTDDYSSLLEVLK